MRNTAFCCFDANPYFQALLDLLLTHGHWSIGQEIRRELVAGRGRGVPVELQGQAFDGDDTMQVD